jgi:hypothetical protein
MAMGTQVLSYDSSGRHVRTDTTVGPGMSVTYSRDTANRLISRAENGVTTAPTLSYDSFGQALEHSPTIPPAIWTWLVGPVTALHRTRRCLHGDRDGSEARASNSLIVETTA